MSFRVAAVSPHTDPTAEPRYGLHTMQTIPDFAADIALALAVHGPVTVDLIETIDVHTEVSLECDTGTHTITCQIFKSSVTPDLDSVDIIRWVDNCSFDHSFHGNFEDAVKFLDNLE